ncbi:MAG TPA: hypothetical protein VGN93_31145 [Shinella sp.]|jgi:hypothetical protein|uniref:hypothetical protein n=1 Tax=Shinella sp. TaxID=1870904 RepID=UPI002E134EB4|nr:hypothetical protein [Shinella sp.]
MGLDIIAHARLTKIEGVKYLEGEVYNHALEVVEYDTYDFVARLNPDFPGRADDIEDRGVYSSGDSFGFGAGAYSGYNRWRERLAELAGYPQAPIETYGRVEHRHDAGAWTVADGPFWELINFSDCEGVIGTAVSKKLAADFAAFDAAAQAVDDPTFYPRYQNWRKAFEMAADAGAVDFH